MAIYHLHTKNISRGKGQAVVASAAYRSGEKLYDHRHDKLHDYSNRDKILHTEIILPENAPERLRGRENLWNEVEDSEKRKDARLAKEIQVALPRELNQEQRIKLVREFAQKEFTEKGIAVDFAIHDSHKGGKEFSSKYQSNPHAHILISTRTLDQDGFTRHKLRNLDKTSKLKEWRESWAQVSNQHLKEAGHKTKIDHRSYKDRGMKKIPTVHLGPQAYQLQQKGVETRRGEINQNIKYRNLIGGYLRKDWEDMKIENTRQWLRGREPGKGFDFEK